MPNGDAPSERVVPSAALDPSLAKRPYAELAGQMEQLRGERNYHDLGPVEREEFDRLARAVEYRLGIHAIDHDPSNSLTADLPSPAASGGFDPPWDEVDPAPGSRYAFIGVEARPIFRTQVALPLTPGPKVFATADLRRDGLPSTSADTRIVVRRGNQTWSNDDCDAATRASCVTTTSASGTFVITVFATQPSRWGTTDVIGDGAVLANDVSFGGTIIDVTAPADGTYSIDTVHVPSGATDTRLVLFDVAWRESSADDNSGMGLAARITSTFAPGARLLVGAVSDSTVGATRATNVLFNACQSETHTCHLFAADGSLRGDDDRDGLANALEGELGTGATDFDSDDDGLFDYVEVIGHAEGSAELPLPQFGAQPRRRDMFIEVDRSDTASGMALDQVRRARDMYLDMPTLVNPDGSEGIMLHLDLGVPCADVQLCGDWGGVEVLAGIDAEDYHATPAEMFPHFAPVRRGIFRYAFEQNQFTGQYSGVRWAVRATSDGSVLAHEFGHTFGLDHGGVGADPRNLKLIYPSTMNYLYQGSIWGVLSDRSRFSAGEFDPIDHRGLDETDYSVGVDKTIFSIPEYRLDVRGDDVDWNRDGRISDRAVLFDDGPIQRHRFGLWPEFADARVVDRRMPTGGMGMAVVPKAKDSEAATTWLFAPFEHKDGTYPEVSTLSDFVGTAESWPPFAGGRPLPQGGLYPGEASALPFRVDGKTRIIVVFPDTGAVLNINVFDPDTGFGEWTQIPGWPEGATARHGNLAEIDGKLVVVFRDLFTPEDEPNVWLARMDDRRAWSAWEQIDVPSWTTPGIAAGPDGFEYLAHVASGGDRPILFSRRIAGSSDPFERIIGPSMTSSAFMDAPTPLRSRVILLFQPYKYLFGVPFDDGSGYLAVFWNGGQPSDKNSEDRDSWHQYRAYVPGFISPTEMSLPAQNAGWRAHGMWERPLSWHSPAVAPRHWDVQVAYAARHWLEGHDIGVFYQPYGGGMGAMNPYPHDDYDDVSLIADTMCSTVRSSTSTECRCTLGPKASCP